MDFGHWLSGAVSRRPDGIAVEAPGESIAYRELLLRAVRAAGALDRRSVGTRDAVALALEPGAAFAEVLHGCLLLGAPVIPVDPRLSIRERFLLVREADVVVEKPGAREQRRVPAAVAARPRGRRPRRPDVRHDRPAGARPADLREPARERPRRPAGARPRGGRGALAVPAAAVARRRPHVPRALHAHGDHRRARAAAVRRGGRRGLLRDGGITVASLVPTQLQRLLDAGAEPGPALRRILLGRPDAPRAARARPRRRLPRLPELRPHAGVLHRHRRRSPATSDRGAAAHRGRHRGGGRRRDPRLRPDGQQPRQPAHGRPRAPGARRPPRGDRPQGRHDRHGRGERRPRGGGGDPRRPPRGGRGRGRSRAPTRSGARPSRRSWCRARAQTVEAAELRDHCAERLASFKVPKAFELVEALPRTESGKLRRADLR